MNPVPSNPSSTPAESVLATYGILLATVLAIAALVIGFGKTNIFIILAISPMIIYFFHEFGHQLFPLDRHSLEEGGSPNRYSLGAFLLQDSPLLRLSLSLLIVAIIAAIAKANLAPYSDNPSQAHTDIVSPLGRPAQ